MRSRFLKLTLLGMFFVSMISPAEAGATARAVEDKEVHAHSQCLSPSMVQLNSNLRKLWIDHVIWTRSYIVSAIAGLEDQEEVLARLLQNQQDLGNAIKPYYGEEAGNKLAGLLKEHILIAGKIAAAAKSGNQADVAKYNKDWYKNADDIAKFLSSANPNWTNKELKDLLYQHLQLLTENVVARLGKNWDADISAFDKGENHIIKLADVLSAGIIKQFPGQFK
ncbi:glycosyltransferase [Paenibacillus wynnii]|uniref:glycosyltransferase n=1 Tax=Paenibacillus wynnii TaxID=268407 RepID=UPI0027939BE3|nr:glycosyltransferase [Paenibacillus wynnii]MDQ0192440.1 REP element-mobilizing transposase RayT [Paenibacillus wynnii]